jgi:hypothetical protein
MSTRSMRQMAGEMKRFAAKVATEDPEAEKLLPAQRAIGLIEKIRRARCGYHVDHKNHKLSRTPAQLILGDMFFAVTIPGILAELYDSVRDSVELHYDTKFDAILAAAIVPRRNGKSTLVMIEALAILECVPNFTAENTATALDQARFGLDLAKVMARDRFGHGSSQYTEFADKLVFHHGEQGNSTLSITTGNLKVKERLPTTLTKHNKFFVLLLLNVVAQVMWVRERERERETFGNGWQGKYVFFASFWSHCHRHHHHHHIYIVMRQEGEVGEGNVDFSLPPFSFLFFS